MEKLLICWLVIIGSIHPASAEEWKEYNSLHFVVYYKKASLDFVKTVGENAENYYKEISNNLGFGRYRYWKQDARAQIYIYNDPDDFVSNGRHASWSAGTTHTRSKVVRTFPTSHGFFDSTLPHELGHIIFREFIGEDTRVPLWFEEGVAMYQEKAKRWGAHDVVRRSMETGEFIDLMELTSFRPNPQTERKKVELFYAEAASIVYYLIQEQGTSRFVRLCHKLQDGVLFEEALKSVYVRFRNMDDLNKAWKEYLKG